MSKLLVKIVSIVALVVAFSGSALARSAMFPNFAEAKEALGKKVCESATFTFEQEGETTASVVNREAGPSARLDFKKAEEYYQKIHTTKSTGFVWVVWEEVKGSGDGKEKKEFKGYKEVEPPKLELEEEPPPTPEPPARNPEPQPEPHPQPERRGGFLRGIGEFFGAIISRVNLNVNVGEGQYGYVEPAPVIVEAPPVYREEVVYEQPTWDLWQPSRVVEPRCEREYRSSYCPPAREKYCPPTRQTYCPPTREKYCPPTYRPPKSYCPPARPKDSINHRGSPVVGNGLPYLAQGGGFRSGQNSDPRGVIRSSSRSSGGSSFVAGRSYSPTKFSAPTSSVRRTSMPSMSRSTSPVKVSSFKAGGGKSASVLRGKKR